MRALARIECSNDPTAAGLDALRLTSAMVEADVIKCGYFIPGPEYGKQGLVAAPMEYFGEQVTPLFLFYRLPGTAEHALAQITFALGNSRGDQLIALFYRAFGNAPSLEVSAVPTSFGPDLADITYVWTNGVSTLHLDTLTVVLNQMSVVFTDNRLWGDLSKRLDTIDRMKRAAEREAVLQRQAAGGDKSTADKGKAEKSEKGKADEKEKEAATVSGAEPSTSDRDTAAPEAAEKTRAAAKPSPAAVEPALAGMSPPDTAGSSGAAANSSPTPSFIEPPMTLPPIFGGFTFK